MPRFGKFLPGGLLFGGRDLNLLIKRHGGRLVVLKIVIYVALLLVLVKHHLIVAPYDVLFGEKKSDKKKADC